MSIQDMRDGGSINMPLSTQEKSYEQALDMRDGGTVVAMQDGGLLSNFVKNIPPEIKTAALSLPKQIENLFGKETKEELPVETKEELPDYTTEEILKATKTGSLGNEPMQKLLQAVAALEIGSHRKRKNIHRPNFKGRIGKGPKTPFQLTTPAIIDVERWWSRKGKKFLTNIITSTNFKNKEDIRKALETGDPLAGAIYANSYLTMYNAPIPPIGSDITAYSKVWSKYYNKNPKERNWKTAAIQALPTELGDLNPWQVN
jgi:hypothetical protein